MKQQQFFDASDKVCQEILTEIYPQLPKLAVSYETVGMINSNLPQFSMEVIRCVRKSGTKSIHHVPNAPFHMKRHVMNYVIRLQWSTGKVRYSGNNNDGVLYSGFMASFI
jgi:hypothetical protein